MLKATIAEREVCLVGCDTMLHAEKFSLFGGGNRPADQRIEVRTTSDIAAPTGRRIGSYRMTEWFEEDHGRYALCQTQGLFRLDYTADFSDVTLYLHPRAPKAEILHYLYVSQSICHFALAKGGLGVHAAGLCLSEQHGILLAGASKTGKSTLTTLLTQRDPSLTVLNEEIVIMNRTDDGYCMYGTPLCGENDRFTAGSAPLNAVVVLYRSDTDRLTRMTPSQAMFGLLETTLRPVYQQSLCEQAVDAVTGLLADVPIFRLDHTARESSAAVLRRGLTEHGLI